jgi:pimeloyl-ACP methyl ester carboxylesterase
MLALAYAAAHPGLVTALALVGCGTFDPAARDRFRATCDQRMDNSLRRRLERLPEQEPDPDDRLRAQGNLILPLYSYDLLTDDLGVEACDARAHEETWQDMVWLQEEGEYPAAFSAVDAPVIMLHGTVDPHPGRMIRASLEPHLPQLEYREWARCGHYPWLESAVREEFLQSLREWLNRQFPPSTLRRPC